MPSFSRDAGQDDRAGRRRLDVRVGEPVWKGKLGTLISIAIEEAEEGHDRGGARRVEDEGQRGCLDELRGHRSADQAEAARVPGHRDDGPAA